MSPTSSKNRIPLSAISKRPIFCAIAPAEGAQELKQELGLGHYEGRGWRGFHHHATIRIAGYGSCPRSSVGSGAGARTVGAGGDSSTFAMDRSPAAMVTFPVPAASNAACGFPALRFPACFMPGVMGPIRLGVLWAQVNDEPDSR